MIDIKILREHGDLVKRACEQKNVVLDIDAIFELDQRERLLTTELDEMNRQRNEAAKAKDIEAGKKLKAEGAILENELAMIRAELDPLLLKVPNLPTSDTPVGKSEDENVVLRQVGIKPSFSFTPKEHSEIGEALGIIDTRRGTDVAGTRFAYLMGDLVLLQNAMYQFALSILTNEATLSSIIAHANLTVSAKAFVPVAPPLFIRPDVFQKMARIEPRDERYHIVSDDLYLIGSAEHTLGPLHMNEIVKEADLPMRYCAFTSAFRREAGSYGKDMKGIIRLHQFDKMEMESFTVAEDGLAEQNFLVAIQEYITAQLGLAYQVVFCCTGDQGDPDARHIDIETWMPGQDKYRETHSADYMTDYQARRLDTKVKRESGKNELVHTNDATAFAGRTLVAVLENYQNEDGSVTIPEVLCPFMNGKDRIIAR
ncbi:MAG: serine--tRNA ligase [Patescibacteria group bacterium]|jgi:seryl-tRNA synthetase